MAEKLREYKVEAPLFSNRFIIEAGTIKPESFNSFKLKFTDNSFKLYLNMILFEVGMPSPNEIVDIKKVKINFLNPIGETVEVLELLVDLDFFEFGGDYGDSELLSYNCTFEVRDVTTLKTIEEEKKMIENYLKRKSEEENKKEDK